MHDPITRFLPAQGSSALMSVAFIIAASRNSLLGFIERALESLASFIPRKGGDK